ncbi:MAG TPA: ethanolamine ammonia-lyase reactivating factor EutA [Xanthobacteraceae bacterium]|nr:ethanolamine ammonia-lyase reactivating factor EutA [Xanthobacteraceae bacterium]
MHVDVGGGTTKLALIDRGAVVGVAAFAVGGRLVAMDRAGAWTRIDRSAQLVADDLGVALSAKMLSDPEARRKIAQRLAAVAADYILDAPLDRFGESLLLTERLPRPCVPRAITFSGGVAEYMFGHEDKEYGDIAKVLAAELARELSRRSTLPLVDPGQRIRATVIGASQFTVQVSGKTIYLPDPYVLPVHNVPVVRVELGSPGAIDPPQLSATIRSGLEEIDLERTGSVAIAFSWHGDPEHARLKAAGEGILGALAPFRDRIKLLLLMIDGDIGKTLGRILHRELHWPGKIVSIDGMELHELDYVDVGELIAPPGVVPVVIKSLLFA